MGGQEKVWAAGNPSPSLIVGTGVLVGMDRRQPAAGDDTMEVRVMGERLPPGVENGDEADLGAQVPWVGGDGAQRLGRRPEQHGIDHGLVLEGDGRHLGGQREDDMEVGHLQQIGLPSLFPERVEAEALLGELTP